ncbi:MAG: sel1 repeat family protein [Candidatus Methanomethylophilaceae archaeon]|nr:sel1 repeat family protein [Candidatus Methanomethylophilaceae archaeon]
MTDPADLCNEAAECFGSDPERSFALFREAAEAGYPNAFFGMAEVLMSGSLGDPDPEWAEELYHVAAEAGHPPSMYRLGMLFSGAMGHP